MNTQYIHLNALYNSFLLERSSKYRANALSDYIHQNGEELATDLSKHTHHADLYQKMTTAFATDSKLLKNLQRIRQQANFLKLSCGELTRFLSNEVQIKEAAIKSSPEKFLMALETVKQQRKELAPVISKVAIAALKLNNLDEIPSFFEERELQLAAIAHLVNAKKMNLKDLNLSMRDLFLLAPQLQYVDCRDIPFKDHNEIIAFISKCSIATHLIINSDVILELKELPASVQKLECYGCNNLAAIKLSGSRELHTLRCFSCPNLKELNASHSQGLQKLDCNKCLRLAKLNASHCNEIKTVSLLGVTGLEELNLSYCEAVQQLEFNRRINLKKLDVSHCIALEILSCFACINLRELNAFNCKALQTLVCYRNFWLEALNLTGCTALQILNCFDCSNLRELNLTSAQGLVDLNCSECALLETIVCASLPHCTTLDYHDSPNLSQLPQVPPGCNVTSAGSIDFISFVVDPDDFKTRPLEMLCHLGEVILRDKRMPNVIFMHSEGVDAGGLRRQLVTSLMQNLFEKSSSPLKLLPREAGVEGTFPLLARNNQQQIAAFKAIGALIALAAHGSLPLGRFLRHGLFHAILSLKEEELKILDPNKPLDKTLAKKIYSLAVYGDPDAEFDAKEMNEQPIMLPIAWAAKGFREITDRAFSASLNDFINRVAGAEATWDNFNKIALYTEDTQDKVKGYFKTFFEKNPHKVNDMVELFTGSRALGVEKIKIIIEKGLHQGSLFQLVTCFQQVKIPPYATYALFEEKLLKTIEHTSGHFGKE